MKRVLRSANRFDDKLGGLFETLHGREEELQAAVNRLLGGLIDGTVNWAPQLGPMWNYDVCILPLIDKHSVVFRPNESKPKYIEIIYSGTGKKQAILDFAAATRIDMLNIEGPAD
jgi:hypothetical protein